jgi:hypothetical protein
MKVLMYILVLALVLGLTVPALAKKGPPEDPGEIPDTGELYGDLYVILRDENGVPMLDETNGCIQPIVSEDVGEGESVTILDYDPNDPTAPPEETIIPAIAGEPFTLATYTDSEGDLVECELVTVDGVNMADWVQSVDFGRLNLGRAPDAVINHAFDEAITKLNDATAITIDPPGRLVLTLSDGEIKTIDSPAENLALYIKMMTDGHWITPDDATTTKPQGGPPEGKGPGTSEGDGSPPPPVARPVLSDDAVANLPAAYQGLGDDEIPTSGEELTDDELLLAASLLAAAADKFGSINLDKVIYINSIYGINQLGSLTIEEDKRYFDFGLGDEPAFQYSRGGVYGSRGSAECADEGPGWIWVLQPVVGQTYYDPVCMEILGYDPEDPEPVNAVHFTDMEESYTTVPFTYDFLDNVRGFTQAADDALQVLEYIHNYKVPEVLYP